MKYVYQTKGTCSSRIDFEINEGILSHVVFTGGCNGNLKAIGKLVEGKPAEEIAALLRGNTCGYKNTSCGDQLAKAIDQALGA
ncbi:MAG: TIGR03905 family TSCPD domain-containing protein [Clostridia bacterium]|nr:TIGR03905 family TSCPD domain-containing protein [Clostridia bacterium]